MEYWLEKLCKNQGIDLTYTDNTEYVLYGETIGGVPVIRAHNAFRCCPAYVAQAMIEYCRNPNGKKIHQIIIENYLKEKSRSLQLKPNPINIDQAKIVEAPPFVQQADHQCSYTEYDIERMTIKDFRGNEAVCQAGSPLTPSDDGLFELNIVIRPPVK